MPQDRLPVSAAIPGSGKTRLAMAIGIEAVQRHHLRMRFSSTIELVIAQFCVEINNLAEKIA